MKSKISNQFLAAAVAIFTGTLSSSAFAAERIKQNNTTALNLAGSWDTLPDSAGADVAVWNNTVTALGSSALGASLNWQGIRVANPGGIPTITFAAGNTLTLGSGGIDMSAATVNLVAMSAAVANTAGTLAISGNQTWNIASGRMLTLFSTSNSANQRLSGSGNIQVSGGGTVTMNVGDAGSTTFVTGNGNDTYTGNWTITGGSKVISLRNGTHAWGTGSITLDNGTISQQQGNWQFSNNIAVASGGGKIYSDSSGNGRYMSLPGIISGAGNLTFDAIAAMTTNEGFILTGANSFNGGITINANGTLRIGGDATTGANSFAAGTLGSIPAAATIQNNGILGFGWSNAQTFANAISGTGVVRLGRSGGTLPAGQVVTLSGVSNYTGATQVNAGRLHLTGSLTSPITVNAGKISGTGSTTGLLTMAAGSGLVLEGGSATGSLTSNGVTFSVATTAMFNTTPIANTVYDVLTYGTGAVTNPSNLSVGWRGTLADDTVNRKYTFTASESQTRSWNIATGTWDQSAANWAEGDLKFGGGDTVIFNEAASPGVVTLSGRLFPAAITVNNSVNSYTFTGVAGSSDITGVASLVKNNAGTLTIATQQSYTGGTTINGGIIDLTGGGGASGSIRGTVTVNSGATLKLSNGDALGYNTDATVINTVNLVGGTLTSASGANQTTTAKFYMTGATLDGLVNVDLFGNSSSITSYASPTTSTISVATMNLRQNDTVFDIADGEAADDLVISSNIGNGAQGNHNMLKNGAGTLKLTALNKFTGNITVNAGVLDLTGGGVFTSASNTTNIVTVNTGGSLKLNSFGYGATASLGQLSDSGLRRVINGGTIEVTAGSESVTNNFSVGVSGGKFRYNPTNPADLLILAGNSTNNIAVAGSLTLQADGNLSIAETIDGAGGLTKTGAGNLTLSGTQNYTGSTIVDAGKLFVYTGGTVSSSVDYTVNTGCTLGSDGSLAAVTVRGGASLSLGNASGVGTLSTTALTLGGTAGDAVTINTAVGTSLLDVVTPNGLLNNATTTFVCSGAALTTPGTYPLATYAGSLGGTGTFGITLPPRVAGTLNTSTSGKINLVISGADTIKWTGASNGSWNTSALNWKQIVAGTATAFINGIPGDTVTFDDSATGTTVVSLSSAFSPALVTVNNSSKSYTISGTGKITGATTSLVKDGSNTLTLGTSGGNDYAGGTLIKAGTIKLGAPDALPTAGVLTLDGGLDLNGNDQTVAALTGAGTVTNTGSGTATLNVANVVDMAFEGLIRDGSRPTGFTKSGAGVLTLTGDNTYTGDTLIAGGTLELGSNGTSGGISPNSVITDNGVLRINRSNEVVLTGDIYGTGGITQAGDGSLTLSGVNGYDGPTRIQYGSVVLGSDFALGSTVGDTIISNGAFLDLNGAYTTDGLILNGVGAGAGSLINSGALEALTNGKVVMASSSTINTVGDISLLGVVSGGFSLTKVGAGVLTLSGVNTYSGGTVITQGTVKLGNGKGIGISGTYGGLLTLKNGTFDINGQTNYSNVNQSGAPTTWLTTAILMLGGMPGTSQIIDSSAAPRGIALAPLTVGPPALVYDATNNPGTATIAVRWTQIGTSNGTTPVRIIDIADSSATDIEVDFSGGWGDTAAFDGRHGVIHKMGAGTVRLSNTNNFPGLRVTQGRFICNSVQALGVDRTGGGGAANLLTVDGGTLDLNGLDQAVGGLADGGVATGVIRNDGAADSTLTIGSSNATTAYSGRVVDGAKRIGITKAGTGVLSLTGANTYTGDTTVTGGILAVSGTAIADTNKLVINGGLVAATGTEVVDTLFFGNVQQGSGTWGATGSGATHIDDVHFSGTAGVVQVTTAGANNYSTWASNYAASQAANLDFDGDGVSNGIEYFMGQTGSSFTANPGVVAGTITWPRDPNAAATFKVQISETLDTWTDIVPPNASIDETNPNQVTYTLPAGSPRKFCRLQVVVPQ